MADIVLTTPQIPALLTPGLRKAMFSTVNTFPKLWNAIFNTVPAKPGSNTGKAYFEDHLVRSVGRLAPKAEYATIDYDSIAPVGTVRYTPYTFALGARISQETIEDELYGVVPKIGAELGSAAMYEVEMQAFKIYTLGFGTTGGGTGFNPVGPQGQSLFHTAHAIARGGTYANRPASATDLSQAALEDATTSMRRTVNESGLPDPRMPRSLDVAVELEWIAKKLLLSEYEPDSANNAINTQYKALSYKLIHYFTDPGMWVVRADKHSMNVWIRRGIQTQSEADFDRGGMKTKVTFRIGTGHSDWRGIHGSPGQ